MLNWPIVIDRDRCRDYAQSSTLEWLETNGTAAFAMGTVSGANTRRYHALLVASLKPPVERFVALSRVEEEIHIDGVSFALGAAQYPGVVSPRGFEQLEEFRLDPFPTWKYAAGGVLLEKQLFLIPGRQTAVLRYTADRACTLGTRPFVTWRDYHSLGHANPYFRTNVETTVRLLRMQPYDEIPALVLHHSGARFQPAENWYYNCEYLAELDRGLDFREDLFTPGVLEFALLPGEPAWIIATIERDESTDAESLLAARLARRPESLADAAADQFLANRADGRPTILAGFPWFTDWGRDTMISLPGLLIARGRLDEARRILEGFLRYLDQGLIPNCFPDAGETPEYNTADATLWMFIAVKSYLDASADRQFLERVFYPAAKEIIEWHRRGTWYGIGVDPEDHLLRAGAPGAQLTWMDAKIGDWVVTPRHGKPVEISALWYNALRLTAEWAIQCSEPATASEMNDEAGQVRRSFRQKFWNSARQCLYDVIADDGPVAKLRPNQIFAVCLPHPLLEPPEQQAVVKAVEAELLTPYGLRTLDRSDPDYKPRYQGNPLERDSAYHQGTVWPWLLGPYIRAYLKAFGRTPVTLTYCRNLLINLEPEFEQYGLGSLAEVYDGDPPHRAGGCPAQAWSVAEFLQALKEFGDTPTR